MKKKIAHRPSEEDIQRSYYSLRTKRHYSKEMIRKAKMGKTAVDRGEDIRDVAIRLFGTSSKSILDLIANQ